MSVKAGQAHTPLRQVGLIGTTCPACGSLAIYVGTRKVGTLSLASTTVSTCKLLTLPRISALRTWVVRFVVVSTGVTVKLDACALTAT